MARIAGVDLPANKRAEIGLTYIYGIGRSRAKTVLDSANVDVNTKIRDLTEEELNRIRAVIDQQGEVDLLAGRSVPAAVLRQGRELVVQDQPRIVEQAADQRGLAVVHRAAGEEAQQLALGRGRDGAVVRHQK